MVSESPTSERVVGLAELEQYALRRNPTLVQASERIEQARGAADQAGRYPNPFMTWDSQSLNAGGTMGTQGAFVQQQIITGGKLRISRARFEVDIEIARWGLREQQIRVLNGVRLRYWQIVAMQRLLEVGAEAVGLAEEVVAMSREKVESGHASEADLLFAENEAAKFQLDQQQLQDRYTNSWREFAANLGSPGMPPVWLEDTMEQYRTSIDWEPTLAWLLAESPEVKIAELNVDRARWVLRRQEVETVPNLILRGGASYDLANDETLGIARVYVDLPLWDRNQGNIYAAQHTVADVQHDVQRVRFSVEQRLSRRFNQYQTSLANVRRYQNEIVPRARKVFELYAESFAEEDASYSRVQSGLTAYNDARGKLVLQLQELRNAETAIVGLLLVPEGTIEAGTPRPPGGAVPKAPTGGGAPVGGTPTGDGS